MAALLLLLLILGVVLGFVTLKLAFIVAVIALLAYLFLGPLRPGAYGPRRYWW